MLSDISCVIGTYQVSNPCIYVCLASIFDCFTFAQVEAHYHTGQSWKSCLFDATYSISALLYCLSPLDKWPSLFWLQQSITRFVRFELATTKGTLESKEKKFASLLCLSLLSWRPIYSEHSHWPWLILYTNLIHSCTQSTNIRVETIELVTPGTWPSVFNSLVQCNFLQSMNFAKLNLLAYI